MNRLTHVAGTFLIQADGSFLNGAGLGEGEDRNVTVPKVLRDQGKRVPYVSAQAWKRWLRETLIEETGWPKSELKAIGETQKGSTSKISGELDPVSFPEDDLFGYMRAQKEQGKRKKAEELEDESHEETTGGRTKAVMRASPFSASLLISLRKDGRQWQGRDEGFVHLKEGTPLPYTTEFYTTNLQGIFCLAHARVGVFSNVGDRIELDEPFAAKYIKSKAVVEKSGIYEIANAEQARRERSGALLKALSVLRGGAKQAAFGTDVAPKLLILAGLSCGNPIFNHLFEDTSETGLRMKVDAFRQVLEDFADRIVTPVAIGLRSGYLANEDYVRALGSKIKTSRGDVEVALTSPRDAAELIAGRL